MCACIETNNFKSLIKRDFENVQNIEKRGRGRPKTRSIIIKQNVKQNVKQPKPELEKKPVGRPRIHEKKNIDPDVKQERKRGRPKIDETLKKLHKLEYQNEKYKTDMTYKIIKQQRSTEYYKNKKQKQKDVKQSDV